MLQGRLKKVINKRLKLIEFGVVRCGLWGVSKIEDGEWVWLYLNVKMSHL